MNPVTPKTIRRNRRKSQRTRTVTRRIRRTRRKMLNRYSFYSTALAIMRMSVSSSCSSSSLSLVRVVLCDFVVFVNHMTQNSSLLIVLFSSPPLIPRLLFRINRFSHVLPAHVSILAVLSTAFLAVGFDMSHH